MTVAAPPAPDPRVGSLLPRYHTPPLPQHADPDAEYGIKPEATWGPQCCFFLEHLLGWHLIPFQRWLYYRALEKRPNGTGFRFRYLVVLMARQNGKTKWGEGLGLWRLFMDKHGRPDPDWPAAKLAVVAAQNLDYAEGTLQHVVDDIRDDDLLAPELMRHITTNGKHKAILTYRRSWRAVTANSSGGRSLSVDFAWLDEMREHTKPDAWRAVTPTTNVRPCAQVLVTSNAGEAKSIVLKGLRDAAIRRIITKDTDNSQTGFFEWSVPDDVDPRDDKYWHMANPALGQLAEFCLEDLHAHYENMEADDLPGFRTEYLCQWVDALAPGIIPAQAWADTKDSKSARAPGADVYLCVDTNYHRTRTYIAAAALRADGDIHTEVIKAGKGTDWLRAWLKPRVGEGKRFKAVCIQRTGAPASGLIEELTEDRDGGDDKGIEVAEWGKPVAQLAAAAGDFYDGITGGTIKHPPAKALDRAAASTIGRQIGDSWFFDRRKSPVDASPLIGCCGAVWLLNNPPEVEGDSRVWDWPDDDIIDQWRKEADDEYDRWNPQPDQPGPGR
jgi:hypothetical protein